MLMPVLGLTGCLKQFTYSAGDSSTRRLPSTPGISACEASPIRLYKPATGALFSPATSWHAGLQGHPAQGNTEACRNRGIISK